MTGTRNVSLKRRTSMKKNSLVLTPNTGATAVIIEGQVFKKLREPATLSLPKSSPHDLNKHNTTPLFIPLFLAAAVGWRPSAAAIFISTVIR